MSGSCVFKELLRMQVVYRQHRPRPEVAEEHCHPESANRDWNDQIEQISPIKSERLVEAGFDVPEQVDEAHENQSCRQPYQCSWIALEWPREQEQEWYAEVEYHETKPN